VKTVKTNKVRTLSIAGAVATLLVTTPPAWAHYERGYERHSERGHYLAAAPRYYNPPPRPAVVVVPRPVIPYLYAPVPVYDTRPAYAPGPGYPVYPTYYGPPQAAYSPLSAIGGAVAGAAIGSGLGQGNGRTASIALGTAVGAMIGNQLTRGR
jgi:hypothetical protein